MIDGDAIGSELRAARESRDLTLDQAEKQTRIRAHYLEALEQGDYHALPSAVQGRGFLRNYARFLGLDAEVLVARFDTVLRGGGSRRSGKRQPPVFADDPTLQSVSRRTATREQVTPARSSGQKSMPAPERMAAVAPSSAETRRRRNRNMTLGTLLIVGISIAALVILILYSTQPNGNNQLSPILSPGPTLAPASDTPDATLGTPTLSRPTPLPNPNGSATPALIQAGSGGITVQITVKVRALLRVTVDGQIVYDQSAAPNSVLQYQGKNTVQIHSGDAGGIDVVVNGIPQEPLGQPHVIVDKTYSLNDLGAGATPKAASQAQPTRTAVTSIGPPPTTIVAAAFANATSTVLQLAIPSASPLAALPSQAPATLAATLPATARLIATKSPVLPSATIFPTQPPTQPPATMTRTPTITFSPAPTRIPSATLTASATASPSRTPIFLPHETITPDSRSN